MRSSAHMFDLAVVGGGAAGTAAAVGAAWAGPYRAVRIVWLPGRGPSMS